MPDPDPELAHPEAAWVLGTWTRTTPRGSPGTCRRARTAARPWPNSARSRYTVRSNPCRAGAPRSARLAWNARVFTVPSGSSSRAAIWD